MKPFEKLISFEEALNTITEHIKPISQTEFVSLDAALGRVSADDIVARYNTPAFNRAAVDGYAVKAADTAGATTEHPVILKLADTLYAGRTAAGGKLVSGECMYIMTGAMMPAGADGVVMVEQTARNAREVRFFNPINKGDHIGRKGEDITRGEVITKLNDFIAPGMIGVLASQGFKKVSVFARPKVAVMPTGEEVVEVGRRLKPGELYDINSHTLAALVRESGGEPVRLPITGDNIEDIKSSFSRALACDILVTSGGSSMGEKDLIVNVLEEWGRVFFHGVNIKPGKPTTFAVVQEKPVFGMPGYPTSCLLNAYLFLGPAIRKMARLPEKPALSVEAKLGESAKGGSGRMRFQTVSISDNIAYPVFKESGAITGMARAQGFIIIPGGVDYLKKGSKVRVNYF
jgi:molybdenum cofactor synthesis domain-containing protein